MKDVIQQLLRDLDWRLSAAGARYKPDDKERTAWGVPRQGCLVTILSWTFLMAAYFGLTSPMFASGEVLVLIGFLLLAPVAIINFFFGLAFNRWLQKRRDRKAYKKLLNEDERFMLVEYSRYLSRRIKQAQMDRSLGGPKEIQQLSELRQRIDDMLRAGQTHTPGQMSTLKREAVLAETVLETYKMAEPQDELAELDARLPQHLRAKVAEVDKTAQTVIVHTVETESIRVPSQDLEPAVSPPANTASSVVATDGSPSRLGSRSNSDLPRWAKDLGDLIESLDMQQVVDNNVPRPPTRDKQSG